MPDLKELINDLGARLHAGGKSPNYVAAKLIADQHTELAPEDPLDLLLEAYEPARLHDRDPDPMWMVFLAGGGHDLDALQVRLTAWHLLKMVRRSDDPFAQLLRERDPVIHTNVDFLILFCEHCVSTGIVDRTGFHPERHANT